MKNWRFKKAFFQNIPFSREWFMTALAFAAFVVVLLSIPLIALLKDEYYRPPEVVMEPFSITVDPTTKSIIEDPKVEATLSGSALTSAVAYASDALDMVASKIAQTPLSVLLALAVGDEFIVIDPGYRKEEVADAFGKALDWDAEEKKAFLELRAQRDPALHEGNFSPGIYAIASHAEADEAGQMVDDRFKRQVLARYGTSTEAVVPLAEALTLASIIERETSDREEMRIISGILWNRIFTNMRLQADATLQYAKANTKKGKVTDWWPTVVPKDKYIKSPYNTYQNHGLPPAPIANPSLSAVTAALAPKKTDCLFYFHDKKGGFHCTETYEEHVALLKKYFGRGK